MEDIKTMSFEEMYLSPEIAKAIKDMGFEEATPIQSQAISLIRAGRDVLGQSQTGTGKTAAFGIPCIEMIDEHDRNLQAVILAPTRELAIQICEEFRKLLKYKDSIKVVPIYGGQPIDRQIMALKRGVQVVVGTPGRVMDHMDRRTLKMETVKIVILDEADEMLDMGFREDIETILGKMPAKRQTVLFSATMPPGILSLTKEFQLEPEHVKVVRKELTAPLIDQHYYEVNERSKTEALSRIIDMQNPSLSLVFCNTKRRVDEVVERLQGRGYFAEALHGDLKQAQRDMVMKKFRNGTLEILVATDVAARGIDVDDIDIVVNYDLPQDEEYYIHRIGRTARAGRSGKAFTFVVGKEVYKLRDISRYTNAKIQKGKLPTLSDIEEAKASKFLEKVKSLVDEGQLSKYVNLAERLVGDEYSAMDVAAALIKMNLYDENAMEIEEVSYSDKPRRSSEQRGRSHQPEQGMVRLYLNIGKANRIMAKDVVGAIAGETGVPGKLIGAIDIFDEFTFVDIPREYAHTVLDGMKNKKVKGNKVNVQKAAGDQMRKPQSKSFSRDHHKDGKDKGRKKFFGFMG
ncbi:MAG: DEAD/DEAH box helicase [Defluviitaleaceae bacterium]|nr:DEAD/DEAH box helicase [Defluviitaleaceae bacterium]